MIIDFTVENWLSFKEANTLSFLAQKPYDNLTNNLLVTPDKNIKLLKSLVIYGANASGKSNFLSALDFFQSIVTKSQNNTVGETFGSFCFLLDKNLKKQPTSFELNFFCEGVRYNYTVIIDKYRVHYEHLSSFPKKTRRNVFRRELLDDDTYIFSSGMDLKPKRIYEDIFKKTLPNVLFLSKAVQENAELLKPLFLWFKQNLSDDLSIHEVADKAHKNVKFKNKLIKFLCENDIDIVDIDLIKENLGDKIMADDSIPNELKDKLLELDADKESYVYDIQSIHKDVDGDNVSFDFKLESRGTHKLFTLSALIEEIEESSKTFYIDELSADLHPLLVKNFIKNFHKNSNNQLIAVTHDTHMISHDILRKDQIYFVEKNKSQASEMYSLAEFHPRGDRENWELRYLSGRYGATPLLMN